MKLLQNRTWTAIYNRANSLGLSRLNYFNDDETDFIINNYDSMTREDIGKILNRSQKVIQNKIIELGLSKDESWNKADDKFIMDNFQNTSPNDISEKLNRSLSSVYHRIQHLGLQRKTKRYGSDDEILEKLLSVSIEISRTPLRKELTALGLPSEIVFKNRFGSYSNACNILGIDVNFGLAKRTICFSKNGDKCFSNAEKKITDFLIDNNIPYKKEVPYLKIIQSKNCGKMVCDWFLYDGVIVEYFGMDRHRKYKEKMERKIALCNENEIKLISINDKNILDLENVFFDYI